MKTIRNIMAVVLIAIAATLAGSGSTQAAPTNHFQVVVRARVGSSHRVYHRRVYHRPYYRRTYHRVYHRPYHHRVVRRTVVRRY